MIISLIKRFWWDIENSIFLIKNRKQIKKIRKAVQNRWASLRFTEGLNGEVKKNIGELYECHCKSNKK